MREIMSIKKYLVKTVNFLLEKCSPLMANIICYMARTGVGTESCLQRRCLPVPIHYYQPIPDIKDLEKRNVWNKKSILGGIIFHPDEQVALLMELGQKFGKECDWPLNPTGNPLQFYTANDRFSFGDAASLYCIIRNFKPHRIIEIGSGMSSLVIHFALSKNNNESGGKKARHIIIDPYPGTLIEKDLFDSISLVKEKVESVKEEYFEQLQKNDILFIDSGHTVRIGSDVNYLILDILPRLERGVIIHLHDVSLPYEYPKAYATNPGFRMFWTEAYLLQAFLCFNTQFEILLAMNYMMKEHKETLCNAFPFYDPQKDVLGTSSFWIRRKEKWARAS